VHKYALAVEALIAMTFVRVLPLRAAQNVRVPRSRRDVAAGEIARVCAAVARRVPASCLVQAVAAAMLFRRYGHDAQLRLGVAHRDGALAAHAWLESEGRTVYGEAGEFVALRNDSADEVVRMRVGDLDPGERRQ
jgi:Transglutaminase-like superfamily